MLTPEQSSALTSLALFAAFADGGQSDGERKRVQQLVESLATESGEPNVSESMRRVLFKQTTVAAEVAKLGSPEAREMAWEAAISICEADGLTTPQERAFLDELASALGRDRAASVREVEQADAVTKAAALPASAALAATLASVPVAETEDAKAFGQALVGDAGGAMTPAARPAATPVPPLGAAPTGTPGGAADPRQAEADKTILRYSILTSAIELLPQGLATVAIIPLQTKMVHSIAATYGYPMSGAMIKEFLATVGVGAAGQVVESYARKFLGSLAKQYLGKSAGKMVKSAVNWGTGPVMTFATTYAIGQVARQYYAGGRTLSAINLQSLYGQQVEKAKSLYAQYEPQIMKTAQNTSATQVMNSLRG